MDGVDRRSPTRSHPPRIEPGHEAGVVVLPIQTAEQGDQLAGLHLEVQAAHGRDVAVALRQAFDRDAVHALSPPGRSTTAPARPGRAASA